MKNTVASGPQASGGETLKIAFLLGCYPAVSHTFLLKEVPGLRERGFRVDVASINLPDRPTEALSGDELEETRSAYYLKDGHWAGKLTILAGIALRYPLATLRGLAVALSLGGWGLREHMYSLFYLAEALLVGRWMRRRALSHLHVHFGGAVAAVGLTLLPRRPGQSCAMSKP